MKRIENWENISEKGTNSFSRIPDGAYIVQIKNATDLPEKECLRIEYDIFKGEYKDYFAKQYTKDTRPNKRWRGSFVKSYKQSALSFFKGFISCVEKSNKGYVYDFDENTLKGKVLGIVIGTEEYISNTGKLKEHEYVYQTHSVEAIEKGNFTVPEIKRVDGAKAHAEIPTPTSNPFVSDDTNPFI